MAQGERERRRLVNGGENLEQAAGFGHLAAHAPREAARDRQPQSRAALLPPLGPDERLQQGRGEVALSVYNIQPTVIKARLPRLIEWLEETHPEPALFGRGAKGRAEVEMWNRRVELGLLVPVAQVFEK